MNEVIRLAEAAFVNPKGPKPGEISVDEFCDFVPMASVREDGTMTVEEQRPYRQISKGYTPFRSGDVLLAKITPCFENGKIALATTSTEYAFGSTEFHVIRSRKDKLDPRYLLHFLRQPRIRIDGGNKMTGSAGQKRVPRSFLDELVIPLPSRDEQRRIAKILDKADAIRRKREQAIALSDDFLRSVFLEMFGDPSTNPMGHPIKNFGAILLIPLRNGISPSSKGKISANVLTLAAITGNFFDADQVKEGKFLEPISAKDAVNRSDFYICRGNGSPDLIGMGYFANRDIEGTAFPDTMIAAKPDSREVTRAYLEKLWNSPFIRNQIREAARTTNGTFKINQTATGAIKIPIPPLPDQQKYQTIVDQVGRSNFKLAYGDDFFPALSQRAFRGDL
jgi:type I restriction enzyme, S subunit